MRHFWPTLLLLGAGACGGNDSSEPGLTEPADENRAPAAVGEIPPATLIAGEGITVDVSPYFRDSDGDPLNYQASSSDAAVASVAASGSSLAINAVSAGAATVTVTASDPDGLSATQTIGVSILSATAPDLVVESPAVSVSSPIAGARFALTATVRNKGDGAAPSTTLRYYWSSDETISNHDTEMGTDVLSSLEPEGASEESIDLTAPSEAGTYYYGACVDAVSGESETANNCSGPVQVVVVPAPPNPPNPPPSARLRRDGSTIIVSWDPAPGATHYNVYYGDFFSSCRILFGEPRLCEELATDVRDTTYTHTDAHDPDGLKKNYYWISACASEGCSELRWAGTPRRASIRVVERSDNSLTITLTDWTDDHFEQHLNYFELYRGTSKDGPYRLVAPRIAAGASRVTHVDGGLNPGTAYYYRTKACNGAGCSGFSTGAGTTEVVGPVEIPPVPTGLSGEKVDIPFGYDDARIWWDAMSRATYYEVYQEGEFDATVNAPYTSYYDSKPNESLGFYATAYSVRACNKAGCSDLSPEFVVR